MQENALESRKAEIEPPYTNTPKSFLTYLAEIRGGAIVEELSTAMRALVEQMEAHQDSFRGVTKGEMRLTLKLEHKGSHYEVTAAYEVKPPKAPAARTILWPGPNGSLQGTNPKQIPLFK